MKTTLYRTILALVVLMAMGAASSRAHTEPAQQQRDKQSSAQSNKKGQDTLSVGMSKDLSKTEAAATGPEPHEVMAAAYLQNVGIFARALRDQAQESNSLSADFARAVVAEMSRSLDKVQEHQEDHKKTLSPELRARRAAVIKEMDTRRSKLAAAINVLEEDVQNYTLNAKQIAADSDAILKHLDEMSKTNSGK